MDVTEIVDELSEAIQMCRAINSKVKVFFLDKQRFNFYDSGINLFLHTKISNCMVMLIYILAFIQS